jgi:hypothetical protein
LGPLVVRGSVEENVYGTLHGLSSSPPMELDAGLPHWRLLVAALAIGNTCMKMPRRIHQSVCIDGFGTIRMENLTALWERLALLALLCHFNTDMILTQDIHNPLVNRTFTFNKASLIAGQTQLLGALSGRTSSPSDDVNASEEILRNDPRARTSKTATFTLSGSNSTTQTEKSDNSTKN